MVQKRDYQTFPDLIRINQLIGMDEDYRLVLFLNSGPYYKSKLELKSNSSEILPVNCKFIFVNIFLFCTESQT